MPSISTPSFPLGSSARPMVFSPTILGSTVTPDASPAISTGRGDGSQNNVPNGNFIGTAVGGDTALGNAGDGAVDQNSVADVTRDQISERRHDEEDRWDRRSRCRLTRTFEAPRVLRPMRSFVLRAEMSMPSPALPSVFPDRSSPM